MQTQTTLKISIDAASDLTQAGHDSSEAEDFLQAYRGVVNVLEEELDLDIRLIEAGEGSSDAADATETDIGDDETAEALLWQAAHDHCWYEDGAWNAREPEDKTIQAIRKALDIHPICADCGRVEACSNDYEKRELCEVCRGIRELADHLSDALNGIETAEDLEAWARRVNEAAEEHATLLTEAECLIGTGVQRWDMPLDADKVEGTDNGEDFTIEFSDGTQARYDNYDRAWSAVD